MSDRFDFESQITKCWTVTDDIYDLAEAIMEHNLSTDQITNVLFGMKETNEIRFNKLWDLFENVHMDLVRQHKKLLNENLEMANKVQMLEDECAAMREQLSDAYDGQGYGIAAIKPNKKSKK